MVSFLRHSAAETIDLTLTQELDIISEDIDYGNSDDESAEKGAEEQVVPLLSEEQEPRLLLLKGGRRLHSL